MWCFPTQPPSFLLTELHTHQPSGAGTSGNLNFTALTHPPTKLQVSASPRQLRFSQRRAGVGELSHWTRILQSLAENPHALS